MCPPGPGATPARSEISRSNMSSRTLSKQDRRRRSRPQSNSGSAAEIDAVAPRRTWADRLPVILLVCAVVITFLPVCTHEFSDWDDPMNVTHNPHLFGQTLSGLWSFWRHAYGSLYIPMTYTVWWVLAKVARVDTPDIAAVTLNPYVFHAANLLLHVGSAWVAYRLLYVLTGRRWASCAGAMLFALHPLQVEPVAWVTGMKDVLSGFLSLVALWQYVLFASPNATELANVSEGEAPRVLSTRDRTLHYMAATLAFAAALLSKPAAVTVPLMAAGIDLWLLRRSWRHMIASLAPWAALSAGCALLSMRVQTASTFYAGPIPMRPLIAGHTLAFYVGKVLFPVGLAALYPTSVPHLLAGRAIWFTWLVPVALAGLAWAFRRRAPWVATALLILIAAVLPVLGLVPFAYEERSTVADRYMYLGLLGPALAAAFLLARIEGETSPTAGRRRVFAAVTCCLVLATLAALSFRQTGYWRDSETIFRRVLVVDPSSDVAYCNLAADARLHGQWDQALAFAQEAVKCNPNDEQNLIALGGVQRELNRHADAEETFRKAAAMNPNNVKAVTNYVMELGYAGKIDQAERLGRAALQRWPDEKEPHRCMSMVLLARGQTAQALSEAQAAVNIDPSDEWCRVMLGRCLELSGRHADAAQQYATALSINPNDLDARAGLERNGGTPPPSPGR
jgi:protein O-mannosyl-transferase